MDKKIYVTQPYMPPLEEFNDYLKKIWESKWLTNNGAFHEELEKKLCEYLDVKYLSLFSNGTLALIVALQCLKITGEVITTPYSFVATTHSLWWNNIKPVFVDIEPRYCNINPEKIEAAITPQTTAILPVHVYGNPCDVEELAKIADNYGLKVIYDAAHAFGVKYKGTTILEHGDVSVLSFHATKVYSTIEGGAIVCHDEKTKKRIDFLKNFGFANETTVVAPGINAKMNEIQAAYGLSSLKYMDYIKNRRRSIFNLYVEQLQDVNGIKILYPNQDCDSNYAYVPVFINGNTLSISRDHLYNKLKEFNIYTRRYFYPLISDFPTYRQLPSASKMNLKVAENKAQQILCLPIYPNLKDEEVHYICSQIKNIISS